MWCSHVFDCVQNRSRQRAVCTVALRTTCLLCCRVSRLRSECPACVPTSLTGLIRRVLLLVVGVVVLMLVLLLLVEMVVLLVLLHLTSWLFVCTHGRSPKAARCCIDRRPGSRRYMGFVWTGWVCRFGLVWIFFFFLVGFGLSVDWFGFDWFG